MGAQDFYVTAEGETAKEAFRAAVEEAEYNYGHSGYTGSIAGKNKFVMIKCPEGKKPTDYAHDLVEKGDDRIDDKWGPAGCIEIQEPAEGKNGKWLFFGWASS